MSEKTESKRFDDHTGYFVDVTNEDGKTYIWVGVLRDSLVYGTPSKTMKVGLRDPDEAIWWFGKEGKDFTDAEMFASYIKSVEQGYALRIKHTYNPTNNVEKALGIS
jgi:hypothetical protein